ncbi:MAG: hypothetical protein ACJ79H_01945, partial [Myxococcales bacterium]
FGGESGTGTSGGMMLGTPSNAPPGSYIVVYGFPVSSGYWCEDEQGYKYKPVVGDVVRNPTLLPDPNLRRSLPTAAGITTCLLVFIVSLLARWHKARRPSVARVVPD